MAMAPEQMGIGIRRHFTEPGTDPYDTFEWERRDARIPNYKDGTDAFFQPDVEFPVSWSQNATNIVAQKYFRGTLGTPERESSLKQVIDRIADTIADWGIRDGYFVDDDEGETFRDELKYVLVHQRAAFNSPVWFNIGVRGVPQQASACQPYDALVSTPEGLVPIGKLVDDRAIGTKVLDAYGLTKVVAVKHNGRKEVLRLHTSAGVTLDVTADHLVWCASDELDGDFVEAGSLRAGDNLERHADDRVELLEVDRIEALGEMDVYDIQTESGEYLSNDLRVHNCFILAVDDTMDAILNWYREEGIIFKGGSGSGINLSGLRSSQEGLQGGGTASGPVSFMRGADASAGTIKCLHAETLISTDHGVVPIRLAQPGWRVVTRFGMQRIKAVHDNGVQSLVKIRTALGDEVLCTAEHRFRVRGREGEVWREAGDLRSDDYVLIDVSAEYAGSSQQLVPVEAGHHREIPHQLPSVLDEPFAMWLGWVYGDGSITTRPGTNFIAVHINDGDPELLARYQALTQAIFGPAAHLCIDRHSDRPDASVSARLASTRIIRFLEANGIRKAKASDLRVPSVVQSSPASVRGAFLAGLFEADGHIGNGYPQLSTVSADFARDVHRLLLSLGIPSSMGLITDRRDAFGDCPVYVVRVIGGEGVRRFAKLVGFVSERKSRALERAIERKNESPFETQWFLPHAKLELDRVWRTTKDQALRRAIAPYCRYERPRRMSLLRARALVERFPRELSVTPLTDFAFGEDLYVPVIVDHAREGATFDLTVAEAHQYLVNSIVTHNSGGKTRRAAKMVILNADHPDIEEFIWCKAIEERKARALREAGFDMDLDGRDSHSIQYQNANNSVRVTDEFMQAVLEDRDWQLKSVTTGEVARTMKARELMRQISEATWECADPGMQFDTTINRWHTAPNTGRINASNPCCFIGETLVNTSAGVLRLEVLHKLAEAGDELPTAQSFDLASGRFVTRRIRRAWVAGHTRQLVDVTTDRGLQLRCTPEHRFLTEAGKFIEARELSPGTALRAIDDDGNLVDDGVASVSRVRLDHEVTVYDLEIEGTHNFAVSSDGSVEHSVVVHNSEYMHLDNSACNLASINLLTYLDDADEFDVDGFKHTVEVVFTAQEILVGNADYPTDRIAETSRAFRQLGLGYANLGALLMARGLPYDSPEGRAWAGAITSLMTGHAYATSARTAARMGPFAGYADNADATLNVLRMHREEATKIDDSLVPSDLLSAARHVWDEATSLGETHGVRNSQASVLAPTGTIALALDCDTTGIEPDLALTKAKKLVGGGTMLIVNQTVPRALRRLGYSGEQVDQIVAYINEHKSIIGAPGFNPEHLPVFACSMGDNTIHYMGHVTMLAAVQPFISGSVSKTVNTPEDVSVEDVEQLHIEAWKLGLKSVAIYRDNCKVAQPLATQTKETKTETVTVADGDGESLVREVERVVEHVITVKEPVRQKLPKKRISKTFSFRVADCHGYVTVGEFEDGRPGEVFLKVAKQGSTLAGIMDGFAIAVSLGLQFGVPLRTFVEKFTNVRFEPAGMTDDREIRFATSLLDYIFRRLAVEYLPADERREIGVLTVDERLQPTLPGVEEASTESHPGLDTLPADDRAPETTQQSEAASTMSSTIEGETVICHICGDIMQRAGSCYACPSCGTTSGCS